MKANRKFVESEEGVSAVIGVILMVAITVAIAATVYVYVSGMMGGAAEKAPTITFTKDESEDTLTVVQADSGIDWSDISMVVSNASGGSLTIDTTDWTLVNFPGFADASTITAGDTMDFTTTGFNTVTDDITVRFAYTPTNALIGTYSLNNVA
ncbi:archaeal flagellin-like protein [Thermoplasmatales archaeon SCGC AB-539-C06]|nr:archaeal flagellin-like protein [Thermoplasmatales archaeon SCGC AB-539-C06]